jgi:NRPS condensation-like uncharacterized protein
LTERRLFPASIVDEGVCITEAVAKLPLTFHVILALEGRVSSDAVRKALDASLDFYPKFKCVLTQNYPSIKRWFRYCWVYRDIGSKEILTETEDLDLAHNSQEPLDCFMEHHCSPALDPTQEVSLRVTLIRQIDRALLVFLFHHAATDGVGGSLFVQRFIKFYDEVFYDRKENGSYTPDFKSIPEPEIRMPVRYFSFRLFYNFLKHLNTLLREPPVQVRTRGEECLGERVVAVDREISQDELQVIRSHAKEYQVPLNDYLLCALFQTVKKWNEERNGEPRAICINVPISLRSPKDHSVGNHLSGLNLFLRSEAMKGKREVLEMIWKDRMSLIMNNVLQITRDLAWFFKPVPLRLKRIISEYNLGQSFSPSICLSNMGVYSPNPSHRDSEGFHCLGQARISRIIPVTLALPWPNAINLIYNGRMVINLTGLSSSLSSESARELLDCFIQQLID